MLSGWGRYSIMLFFCFPRFYDKFLYHLEFPGTERVYLDLKKKVFIVGIFPSFYIYHTFDLISVDIDPSISLLDSMSNYHDNKNILLESIDYNELIISKPRKK
jgi:hypothetical protein